MPKVFFRPLAHAFEAICIDDMGRDALRQGPKKVVRRNSGNTELSFSDGVLIFDHHPVTNLDYGDERKKTLQLALEQGL